MNFEFFAFLVFMSFVSFAVAFLAYGMVVRFPRPRGTDYSGACMYRYL